MHNDFRSPLSDAFSNSYVTKCLKTETGKVYSNNVLYCLDHHSIYYLYRTCFLRKT